MWFDVLEPPQTCFPGNDVDREGSVYRGSTVFSVLSPKFGVVQLHRTFSIYSVTGETRGAGCLCTSSGWFKHSEPRRTFPMC